MSTTSTPTAAALPADLQDDRLVHEQGLRGHVTRFVGRLRSGDLGAVPVVVGLAVIWLVFYALNPVFLSSRNLVNLTLQSAAIGTIALGVVLVLLVAEIDLSVGSVSGVSAAVLAVAFVQNSLPLALALVLAVAAGTVVGLLYGLLYVRFGVPSFVITLAGLLGFLGVQLYVLGDTGSINLPFDSAVVRFAQQAFLPDPVAYALAVLIPAAYAATRVVGGRRRAAAGLSTPPLSGVAVRAGLLAAVLLLGVWYLQIDRGVSMMFALFALLVVLVDVALRRTRWGRAVFAVGGNVEAARRAGIAVNRVYVSVFMLTSTLAAVGGIFAASRVAAANQSSGGADTNLNAIAAAVIGGTSLFGGRGSAYSALLGVLVIMSISSGLTLLNLDSSVRYMVTGAVLLLAVTVDSLSRRSRRSHGRA
ncbi:ABC transporter permease [Thalassiella azotivora]